MNKSQPRHTLENSLKVVLPQLPSAIAGRDALLDVRRLARALPPVPWAGFECRLGKSATQVDLQQGIALSDDSILLDHIELMARQSNGTPLHPAWHRLRDFCTAWADASSLLHANVPYICLEFDVHGSSTEVLPPSVFIALKPDALSSSKSFAATESSLGLLSGGAISSSLRRNLARVFEACPKPAFVSHVGCMLSRDSEAVRVNVKRLPQELMTAYLKEVGWSGAARNLETVIADLFDFADRIALCLDVGKEVYPAIGLECIFAQQPESEPRWERLLDWLVEKTLCAPEKREAMLKWRGQSSPPSSAESWPEHLVAESLLRAPAEFSVFDRRLSHIKIAYEPRRPLQAKGYLEFVHKWFQSGVASPDKIARVEDDGHSLKATTHPASAVRKPNDLSFAIDRAVKFLVGARTQAGLWLDYPESRLGAGDEWAAAYVGAALAALPDERARGAARQSWRLLLRRRQSADGWGWNDHIPADADTTAWALLLARRLGVRPSHRIAAAHSFLARHVLANGGVPVYLEDYFRSFTGIENLSLEGFCSPHLCVTAAVAALEEFSAQTCEFLRDNQNSEGYWKSYWWDDHEYATALSAEALSRRGQKDDGAHVLRAARWAAGRVEDSGGVHSVAHDGLSAFVTALCVRTMIPAAEDEEVRERLERAVKWLLDNQRSDGSWSPSARMLIPPYDCLTPQGHPGTAASVDALGVATTATVLTALESLRVRGTMLRVSKTQAAN